MFLSWILSYQDLHMIAFPGLIISILFLCRITYSILAHFYLVYLSLQSPTLISFQLCLCSSTSYLDRYSSYCGSVTIYLHRYSTILQYNFTKEISCGTQTAPVFPTVLSLQQAYASSANHHGISARRQL